ncbi:hypothetical protein ACLQ3K_21205 [Tsukamurella sp. DT100]|uniref:hypothetical protein n=1 Tax=Tsukamurella sp. DT100 TaxID=3393415 RepID=UPI003CF66F47
MTLADLYTTETTSTALNHLSNWTGWTWAAAVLSLIAVVGIAAPLAMAVLSDEYNQLTEEKFNLYLGIVLALTSIAGFAVLIFQIARHSAIWQRGALVTALAVGIVVVAAFMLTKGLTAKVIAGGVVVYGAGVLIIDGLHRVASWIPTTVGTVVLAIAAFSLYAYTSANGSGSRPVYRQARW